MLCPGCPVCWALKEDSHLRELPRLSKRVGGDVKLWGEGLGWVCGKPDGMTWEGTRVHPGAVGGGWTEMQ